MLAQNAIKITGLAFGIIAAGTAIDNNTTVNLFAILGVGVMVAVSAVKTGRTFQQFVDENKTQSDRISSVELGLKALTERVDKMIVDRRQDTDYARAEQFAPQSQGGLWILIVDDNQHDRYLFRRALPSNYRVDEASSLKDGIDKAHQVKYDCVVLDLRLPDSVPDVTVAEFVSAHPLACCIAMSGSVPETVVSRIIKQGADSFISKGIYNGEYLNKMIRLAIQRNKTTLKSDTDFFRRTPK